MVHIFHFLPTSLVFEIVDPFSCHLQRQKLPDFNLTSGARFSKAPESFRTRKATFRSSVSKNGEVYTPETCCMKGTSLHLKNLCIKQLCNRKVRDFAMALRARKVSGLSRNAPQDSKIFPAC